MLDKLTLFELAMAVKVPALALNVNIPDGTANNPCHSPLPSVEILRGFDMIPVAPALVASVSGYQGTGSSLSPSNNK